MKYPKGILVKEENDNTETITIYRDHIAEHEDGLIKRTTNEFKGLGYYLPKEFDWVIIEDSSECFVLIPLKKEKGIND